MGCWENAGKIVRTCWKCWEIMKKMKVKLQWIIKKIGNTP
jgi:hypothetical protein